jgi:1-acyl-sn-glycerol-3-phosphate acyltransferase
MLLRALFSIEMVGLHNIPPDGPFIAAMNHIFFIDPILVSTFSNRMIVIMSKIENYSIPLVGPILHLYGTFPVHRGETDMHAIRTSLKVLDAGLGLLMAPEGTRSPHRTLQPGRDGMALIALRSAAPIVPVGIAGQEKLWTNLKRLRRTPVRLAFGEPFLARPDPSLSHKEQLHCVTHDAMVRLAALLPREYRGVYADKENPDCDWVAVPTVTGTASG